MSKITRIKTVRTIGEDTDAINNVIEDMEDNEYTFDSMCTSNPI